MDKYLVIAKDKLSHYRYTHVLGVCEMAEEIAKRFNLNSDKCKTAAILHDITKEDKNLNTLEHIKELTDDDFIINSPSLWHAYTAADFARNHLKINDQDILEAIQYHTIGMKNLSDIAKVIFISDVIEKNRKNKEAEVLRIKFHNTNMSLEELLKEACEIKMHYGKIKNLKMHPNLQEMYDKLT